MAAAPEQMGRCRAPAVALSPVRAYRASDGATMWSVPSPLTTNLTAGPDAVYAVAVALYALNSRHGTRLWSCAANAMTAPLLAGGVIYVPGCDTYSNTSLMLAIRASDGARLWEVSPGPGDGWLAYDGTTVCAVSGVSPDAQPPPDAGRSRPRCGPGAPATASCCTGHQSAPATAHSRP